MKAPHLMCFSLVVGLFLSCSPAKAIAKDLSVIKPVVACEDLTKADLSKVADAPVKIDSAAVVETAKGKFCKVKGNIEPSIGFEIDLPLEHWTQRFLEVGCGGLCGDINLNVGNAGSCVPALNGEFVVSSDNMGHGGSMMDASWAADPQKRIDFAYRGNHATAQLSKALIGILYGKAPRFSYFMGCSDGGREALTEAQRFPEDFDGISAGAPAAFFSFQNSFYHGWNIVGNQRADGSSILLKSRLSILHKAVLAHCPTQSGVEDGLLEDPYSCNFDPSWVAVCASDAKDQTNCMTAEEINAAENFYNGPTDAAGHQFIAGGLPLGSELNWGVPSRASESSMSKMMVIPALQWVLLEAPAPGIKDLKDFPLNQESFDKVSKLATLYNAANTNLRPFQSHGGKLLLWHGLADDSVTPAFTLAYYQGVQKELGAELTDSFLRLFLLPGVGHCGHGEGYDQIDLLSPLMAWTEEQTQPKVILSEKVSQQPMGMMGPPPGTGANTDQQKAQNQFHGPMMARRSDPFAQPAQKALASRPVYPYPYVARYTGKGNPKDAASYEPVKPDMTKPIVIGLPAASFIGPDNQKFYEVKDGKLVAVEPTH
jgi:feruloyl esterase